MDIKDLNRFSIKEYLAGKGIYPVKDRGYYGMYHSPFREDKDASMKVDYNKNLWIDFGSNEGGTLIDLVMRINNCSLTQAINELEQYNSTSVNQYNNKPIQQTDSFSFHGEPSIILQEVKPITNPALADYLKERAINVDIAKLHCKEVHYSVNNKAYFAIGFSNNSGGYELRSKYFKGCTSKDCTTNNNESDACLIFEGVMDYLSYLTLKNIRETKQDTVILNSVANLPKALNILKDYKEIRTYLDNDESGRKATNQIKAGCVNSILKDQSIHYTKHKDLNDYLVSIKEVQKIQQEKQAVQVKRKPSRGFKM